MKKIIMCFVYDKIAKVPCSGLIPCANVVVAVRGFKNYLKNDEEKVNPEELELRQLCFVSEDFTDCELDKKVICSGDKVEEVEKELVQEFLYKEAE